jgi:hypothetical protein
LGRWQQNSGNSKRPYAQEPRANFVLAFPNALQDPVEQLSSTSSDSEDGSLAISTVRSNRQSIDDSSTSMSDVTGGSKATEKRTEVVKVRINKRFIPVNWTNCDKCGGNQAFLLTCF